MAKKKKSTPSKKGKSKKTQKRSILGFLVKWCFVLGLWGAIILAGIVAWYAKDLPDITEKANFERKTAILVKDNRGQIVARYGDIVGNKVSIEDLPPHLIQAVLAIEDRRFYDHPGLDPLGLARAIFVNTREGRVVQGGSTITQQLAKNLFLSRERKYKRKIQEALLAFWLEHRLTKDEILAAYLNRVYLGSGTYGVDAAAKLYFGAAVGDLTLRESAGLAGLLKAPSRYSPLRNPTLHRQRTDTVLSAMVDAGYITEGHVNGKNKTPPKPIQKPTNELADRFYSDWIVDQLDDIIGTPEEDLIIETTLNSKIQNQIAQTIDKKIAEYGEEKNITEGAMVIMRPNGEVVALIGGRNYNASQFNRATQALRSPGSSFKPFVYLTALEYGWKPYDTIVDEPMKGRYRPKNFGGKYLGEVTLEEALTHSLNTVSVRLMHQVSPEAVIDTARRLGITSELEPDLSLALGSSGVSLLEMANAYAILANGGRKVEPFGITKIISKDDGTVYYERPRRQSYQRVFSAMNTQNITSMMNSVVEYGTGRGANFGAPAAGKTGTSNESRDALFIGFTRELVGAVWLGNDDNSSMKRVTGGSYPAQIWREVMQNSQGQYAALSMQDFTPATNSFNEMIGRLFNFGDDSNNPNAAHNADMLSRRPGNPPPPRMRERIEQQRDQIDDGDDDRPITQRIYNQRYNGEL